MQSHLLYVRVIRPWKLNDLCSRLTVSVLCQRLSDVFPATRDWRKIVVRDELVLIVTNIGAIDDSHDHQENNCQHTTNLHSESLVD